MLKLISPLDQIDSAATFTLGSRTMDKSGNEYVYLSGVASVAAYDFVTFTGVSSGSVTRLTAQSKGDVAIAQAAIVNNKYGWFLCKGQGKGNTGFNVTAGAPVYSCGTAGTVGYTIDTAVGSLVASAFFKTASTGGSAIVLVHYPFITNTMT